MLSGHCRITVFSPDGTRETADFGPGDVWYFPRGYPHSIQALADGCHFILTFDDGKFSEFGTFSLTDWVGHTPAEVLAKNFGVPASTFAKFPKEEVYIVPGKVPPPLSADLAVGLAAHRAADAQIFARCAGAAEIHRRPFANCLASRVSDFDDDDRRDDDDSSRRRCAVCIGIRMPRNGNT